MSAMSFGQKLLRLREEHKVIQADVTQIYAAKSLEQAVAVAKAIG